jgi:hypothetical protein
MRDAGLQESPLTSRAIAFDADVDVSELEPESHVRVEEAPAPNWNENGLDYDGSSMHSRLSSDDPR